MEKVKVSFLIPKVLSEAIDKLIALAALKNNKLQKTNLVTEALMREYFRKRLEIERSKLKILKGVDLGSLIDKMIEIKDFTSELSDDEFRDVTGFKLISETGFRTLDKNINENGEEINNELSSIASIFDVAGYRKGWDKETVRYLVLLAIQDCRKIQEYKEQYANSLEKTLRALAAKLGKQFDK